jgi:hypothetical protein
VANCYQNIWLPQTTLESLMCIHHIVLVHNPQPPDLLFKRVAKSAIERATQSWYEWKVLKKAVGRQLSAISQTMRHSLDP